MTSAQPTSADTRLEKLRAGEPLEFTAPPPDGSETPEQKVARTIPAAWLASLAASHERRVGVPVAISHAIFEDSLDLDYVNFACSLAITDCQFLGSVNFLFATFERGVQFDRSSFEGPTTFRAAQAKADFEMIRTSFGDHADFSDLHVGETLDARGATFNKATFQRINIAKSAYFRTDGLGKRTEFGAEAGFHGAHVGGQADFSGAEFKGEAAFDGFQVDSALFFRTDDQGHRTEFGAEARFLRAHVGGEADFSGAEFKGEAAFDGFQVDGNFFFRTDDQGKRTEFGADARFRGAHVGGQANFSGAQFKRRAAFDHFQVDGNFFFRTDERGNRTEFGTEARFLGARVGGQANFIGAEFKGKAAFDGFQVDGVTLFRPDSQGNQVAFGGPAGFPSAVFGADAQFIGARFSANADFDNAHFKGAATFDSAEFAPVKGATFIGARFERGAYFDSTQFRGPADFTAAVAERDVRFIRAVFSAPVSFREARFHAVFFADPDATAPTRRWPPWANEPPPKNATTWGGNADLRGFTYERIYLHLPSLFPRLTPFDRQPYSQLESALRSVGEDRRARQVYLERRRAERKEKCRSRRYAAWLFDCTYSLVANYGVFPIRLLVFALAFIMLGAFLFRQPGALEPAGKDQNLSLSQAPSACLGNGLAVSFHYFLPMDVPIGADCKPVAARLPVQNIRGIRRFPYLLLPSPSWYATIFLRVAGAILMGIGLAAATGLLRSVAH